MAFRLPGETPFMFQVEPREWSRYIRSHNDHYIYSTSCKDGYHFKLHVRFSGALLLDHASSDYASNNDVYAAERFCNKALSPFVERLAAGHYGRVRFDADTSLVMAGHGTSAVGCLLV